MHPSHVSAPVAGAPLERCPILPPTAREISETGGAALALWRGEVAHWWRRQGGAPARGLP